MAIAFLIYIVPQINALIKDPYPVHENYVDLTIILSILCVILFFYGYIKNQQDIKIINYKNNNNLQGEQIDKTFFYIGIVYTIIGFMCNIAIGGVDIEAQQVSQWTGILTVYAFFQRLLYVGFAINLHCVLRKNRLIHWLMLGISLFWPIFNFLFYARRTEVVIYISIIMLTIWFTKGYIVNRTFIFVAVIIGFFFMNSIGAYRAALSQINIGYSNWQDFFSFNWLNNWLIAFQSIDWWNTTTDSLQFSDAQSYISTSHSSETKYVASVIQLTNETKELGYGSILWNRLVFGFVPAQFLGNDFKESLFIYVNAPLADRILNHFSTQTFQNGYVMPIMGELFSELWFFGFFLCYFIGKIFKHFWLLANKEAKIYNKILYPIALAFSVSLCLGGLAGYVYNIICFMIFLAPVKYIELTSRKNK
ncbi:hypothetical protein H6G06_02445 [Anabaena sphaerica FACHB-251]|uniref:Oligosaccharide repeat unit polymerase n=1 Tax=Anabaena sphaerica FACHB-251 TaxID=2692883 RepID=A0A926WDB7_9NOST|nr:hypothetical protein [Anabaena sphaerica]MBD2292368.1 hypothetical protein [Anabaena sphaerica FACHB-251]